MGFLTSPHPLPHFLPQAQEPSLRQTFLFPGLCCDNVLCKQKPIIVQQ